MSDVLDRIRKLDEEKRKLLSEARDQALAKANQAIEELRELGFNYRLTEGSARSTSPERSAARKPQAGAACPICGFATEPPHDKRSHRTHPAPFTDAELSAKGWRKI
jgi:hypothetical protein